MKFKQKRIQSGLSVGQRLKRSRLRKKISLEEVEAKTKIRLKYLKLIEQDSFNQLPSQVYVKGFLKTYARFLSIDENNILDQFKKENYGIIQDFPGKIEKQKINFKRFIFHPKFLIYGFVGLVIVGFLGFLVMQIMGFVSPPELTIYQPSQTGNVKTNEIIFSGKTEPGAEVYINNQLIAIDAEGNFKEKVFLKYGTNLIELKAKNKAGRENTQDFNFYSTASQTIAGVLKQPEKTQKGINLKLNIGPNSSWIKIMADNKLVYKGIMIASTEQIFTAKKEIVLSVGNAGSTKININGNNIGILGKEGEVKNNLRYISQ